MWGKKLKIFFNGNLFFTILMFICHLTSKYFRKYRLQEEKKLIKNVDVNFHFTDIILNIRFMQQQQKKNAKIFS